MNLLKFVFIVSLTTYCAPMMQGSGNQSGGPEQEVRMPKAALPPAPQSTQVLAKWTDIERVGSGVIGHFKVVTVIAYGPRTPILPGGTVIIAVLPHNKSEEELIELRNKAPQGDWQIKLSYHFVPEGTVGIFNWVVISVDTNEPE